MIKNVVRKIGVNHTINTINYLLHAISITIGLIAGIHLCSNFPNLYIGKIFLIYIISASIVYMITRIILCAIFRPIIFRHKEKWMGN